ncbi:tyrosine--tRNA ligase [Candidatus Pacearchaeota archaeon]|nr:tyrosine--tRNA ligase [Candidatus Pacearchaeota archaeon]MBD3283271.1 tyrosine--tRNA ligase [Candidatus Pacearchaeota archaeon]
MAGLDAEERFELIKRNTQEIVREDELKNLLKKNKEPVVYWGTSVTGKPSIAYLFPLLKLSDFVKAGFKVKVLLADLHGALDRTPWPVLEHRYDYYKEAITLMFKIIGTDLKKIEFVKGSEFQLKPEYSYDVLKLASMCSIRDCKKAASEVVKFGDNPHLGGLIYPIMQAIDEVYLDADVQYGGLDQRKILMFARENLPRIGYDRRVEVMTPMIPGLIGKKMSSSDEKSKIDLTDDDKTVREKINKADCVEGNPDNGIMAFLKYVIMVMKEDKKEKFLVERDEKYGGNVEYGDHKEIEKDFVSRKLHPQDLKLAVAKEINKMLEKADKKKLDKLAQKAY